MGQCQFSAETLDRDAGGRALDGFGLGRIGLGAENEQAQLPFGMEMPRDLGEQLGGPFAKRLAGAGHQNGEGALHVRRGNREDIHSGVPRQIDGRQDDGEEGEVAVKVEDDLVMLDERRIEGASQPDVLLLAGAAQAARDPAAEPFARAAGPHDAIAGEGFEAVGALDGHFGAPLLDALEDSITVANVVEHARAVDPEDFIERGGIVNFDQVLDGGICAENDPLGFVGRMVAYLDQEVSRNDVIAEMVEFEDEDVVGILSAPDERQKKEIDGNIDEGALKMPEGEIMF